MLLILGLVNPLAFQGLYVPAKHPVGQKRSSEPFTEKEGIWSGHMAGEWPSRFQTESVQSQLLHLSISS